MINLTDLKAKAEAAERVFPGSADYDEAWYAYIAAASPAAMLPLINALIEWRDARAAWLANTGTELEYIKYAQNTDALVALITEQETNNDAG